MSFPTQPTFVCHSKGWTQDLLVHPMMKFLYEHQKDFDAKTNFDNGKPYYASDFVFTKSTGQSFSGDAAHKQMAGEYASFKGHSHEPVYSVVTGTADGYSLFGQGNLFADLPVPGEEKKYEDSQGRKWDCMVPGAFLFEVAKDKTGVQGMKLTAIRVFANPIPILAEAVQRKVIPVEALVGGI